jgi:hypothetical protein
MAMGVKLLAFVDIGKTKKPRPSRSRVIWRVLPYFNSKDYKPSVFIMQDLTKFFELSYRYNNQTRSIELLYFKNRELAERLSINLPKWKRWVREFLPADPLGGRQSGYARQLNLRDSFKVYLGGYLVSAMRFTIPEARFILSDITSWLKQNGFHSLHLSNLRDEVISCRRPYFIFIYKDASNGFAYVIREMASSGLSSIGSNEQDIFARAFINLEDDWLLNGAIYDARVLSITLLCKRFYEKMNE